MSAVLKIYAFQDFENPERIENMSNKNSESLDLICTREELGKRLSECRKKKDLLQSGVAQKLFCDASHISRIESGRVGVTVEELARLSLIYGKSIDSLVFKKPEDRNLKKEVILKALHEIKDQIDKIISLVDSAK